MLRASVLYLLISLLLLSGCGQKGALYRAPPLDRETPSLDREAPPQEPASEESSRSRDASDETPPQD